MNAGDHADRILLGVIAVAICILLGFMIWKGGSGWDAAAFVGVLTLIVKAIETKWQSRTIDRMGQQLGASAPTPESVEKTTVEGPQQ